VLRPSTAAHLYYVELIIHTLPWFVVMAIQIAAEEPSVQRRRVGAMDSSTIQHEARRRPVFHGALGSG